MKSVLQKWIEEKSSDPDLSPSSTSQLVPEATSSEPERRLALLRAMGGDAKKVKGEWRITGITELVYREKADSRKRSDQKTIRVDLKAAAEAESEDKRAGPFKGLGSR